MAKREDASNIPQTHPSPKIMIIGTNVMSVYQHRLELIERLLNLGMRVVVVAPEGEETELLKKIGCTQVYTKVENRGSNPVKDMKFLMNLVKIIKSEEPDLVLTFYTKTNIYGGIACRLTGVPYIENITGLGSALANGGLMQKIMTRLYSIAIKEAEEVFFQNTSNMKYFKDKKLWTKSSKLLPGSGVALMRHPYLPYPEYDTKIKFAFIGRILREKGINDFLGASQKIKTKYPNTEFHVVGPSEGEYAELLHDWSSQGLICYHGKLIDMHPVLEHIHCLVYPSYYAEGMANVLLEAAAAGRPLITTTCPGCGETVDDGVTGYMVRSRDVNDLADKMEQFLKLTGDQKKEMGLKGREKMEREFNRNVVVESYIAEIRNVLD